MSDAPFDLEQAHRRFAVELNNRAWDLVEQEAHTDESIAEMLHAAHAACWHWSQIGTPVNAQRAYCLLATACAKAGHGESAARFAGRCLALSEENSEDLTDFDHASAFGCNAKAASLNGHDEQAAMWRQRMTDAVATLPDPERALLERLFG